jgi:acyl-CoA thioesterase I
MKKILLLLFVSLSINAKTILFLGDSLTEGYGVEKKYAYPALIGDALKKKGHKVKIINGGVSGSTTASGHSRLMWFLKAKPDVLFLALGANDGLRGQSVKNLKANLDKIIILAKEKKLKVILAQMLLPPNYGKKYTESFKQLYRDLAKKHEITLVPFLLQGVAGNKKLNIEDGIHPNQKGYEKIRDNILKYLEPLL